MLANIFDTMADHQVSGPIGKSSFLPIGIVLIHCDANLCIWWLIVMTEFSDFLNNQSSGKPMLTVIFEIYNFLNE